MDTIAAQEKQSSKRTATGIEAQKQLLTIARSIQTRLLKALPSNYTENQNTNLAEFFRAVAKEFSRVQTSASDINEDKYHAETRPEYLFQVLGDALFLGEKAVTDNISDTAYRDFLIKVRNAYYGGSRKDNIEQAVSDILGVPVVIKELYLYLREQNSFYNLKDTHKMFFDILMDSATASSSVGLLLENIKFFIDVIKPAHVLYDTRLVWTEELNTEASCRPSYMFGYTAMASTVYGTSRIYQLTHLVDTMYRGLLPVTLETGAISGIDTTKGIVDLTDNKILVCTSATDFYVGYTGAYTGAAFSSFNVGDAIAYDATIDSPATSSIIKADWGYTGIVDSIDSNRQTVVLLDGSTIVYNLNTLAYTRDKDGEYRIEVEDLRTDVPHEIAFKAEGYTGQFQFYRVPPDIVADPIRQFDDDVINKPIFQEYVKKNKDIADGAVEGYDVVVIDGVATVVEISSKFYKRADAQAEREKSIYRYSLFISDVFEKQFSLEDTNRALTTDEALDIFMTTYGYTGLLDPDVVYRIDTAKTGTLTEDGASAFVQTIDDHTEMCDRKASCLLAPYYEDIRRYWAWPDLQLVSGFIDVEHNFGPLYNAPGEWNVPGLFIVSSDPNSYTMPNLPMLDAEGNLATPETLVVYVNGLVVPGSVVSVDPWAGTVQLDFIPPFDSSIRIDYYYTGRYPADTTYYATAETGMVSTRLCWPFPVTGLYGDIQDYQVNDFPILSKEGYLATEADVTVSVGSLINDGTLYLASTTGVHTVASVYTGSFTGVEPGDTLILDTENYLDNTLIYTVYDHVTGAETLEVSDIISPLAATFDYRVIRYAEDPGVTVTEVRPLLGHVHISSMPPVGTLLRFTYHYTNYERHYLMIPDPVTGMSGFSGGVEYTSDCYYGSRNNYALMGDEGSSVYREPYWAFTGLEKIGYRYRVLNLSGSSVLNSDTFILNDYAKYGAQAASHGRQSIIGQYNPMFSAEYLTDTDKNIILNDKYLEKDITPNLILNPGVPPFVKTFTDDGHHKNFEVACEEDTYDPGLTGGMDLMGAFQIIDPDQSGIIDYDPVCSYDHNKQIRLYSDLALVEFPRGDYEAPLSSIDDSGSALPFKFTYIEQYYPNRELRLNDYLDYINQVPTEYKSGTLRVLNQSRVVKSIEKNFRSLRIGDTFTIKDVSRASQGLTGIQDLDYILVKVVDYETAELNTNFVGPSGEYAYDLTSNKTYTVDVYLNEVQRTLSLGVTGYSLPPGIAAHFSGINLYFRDPDPDPTPANPDNPWISNPPVMYYPITGLFEYRIDAGVTYAYPVITNRTLGVTGWILTSQIVDGEGNSLGYTGGSAGVTGPSGALDLGISGPTDSANPRVISGDDVYQIPSGDTGTFISYSEAEYRVQWRNWDQDKFLVWLGVTGIMTELPLNSMDDHGEGILRYYWDVAGAQVKSIYFNGSLVESTEKVLDNVVASAYPLGMIILSQEAVDAISTSLNPVADFPELQLGDAIYQLNRRIVRELIIGDVKVTEIQEFIPL